MIGKMLGHYQEHMSTWQRWYQARQSFELAHRQTGRSRHVFRTAGSRSHSDAAVCRQRLGSRHTDDDGSARQGCLSGFNWLVFQERML